MIETAQEKAALRRRPRSSASPSLEDATVAGGGVSGLYAALLLARRGFRVNVLERAERVGGLAASESFRGVPCDLGSHRLHPDALARPLFRELDRFEPLLTRERRGVLVMGDRHVPYPPRAGAMLRALGARTSLDVALSMLGRGDRRRAFARWDHDRARASELDADAGFERFVVDRVGRAAFRAFYEPYARKVWGLAPSELSQSVAKKRVSTTSPWSLLTSAAGKLARKLDRTESPPLDRFLYPAGGIASIVRYLERELAREGVTIACGQRGTPALRDGQSGPILFAGDLADLVETSLEHRGLYLVYLAFRAAPASPVETYYAHESRYWFGRVSAIGNYSPALQNPGETILCVEIPEGAWGRGVDFTGERLGALVDQLRTARIVMAGQAPIEVVQRFVPSVYPLYRRGWLAEWRAAMRRVAALGNVWPIGRQALFLHCNLDHCADIAEDAVAELASGGSAASWITQAERYLELVVRD